MQTPPCRKGHPSKNWLRNLTQVERHQPKPVGLQDQIQRLDGTFHLDARFAGLARQADPFGAGGVPPDPEQPCQIDPVTGR
jgi:hypothetical protein